MKIKIVTPTEYEEEYVQLLRKATDLMRKQGRSAHRYAKRIDALLNKAARLVSTNKESSFEYNYRDRDDLGNV